MSPRVRRLLRVALTLALCAFVLPRVDFAALGRAFARLDLPELLALSVLVGVQQVLLTKRFGVILDALSAVRRGRDDTVARSVSLLGLLVDQQVATAYNVILPSTVGGDVVRVLRARQRLASPEVNGPLVWAGVLLDRFIGLLALVVVPLAGLLSGYGNAPSALVRTAAVATAVLVPIVLFAGRVLRLFARLAHRHSERISTFGSELACALDSAPRRTRLAAFAWSLAYQLSVNAFFHVAAAAFGLPWSSATPAIWIGIPLVFVLATLPVTVGGLGLRESLFVGVLGLYGVLAEQALAMSLLWSAQGLVTALVGLIVLWSEKPAKAAFSSPT